MGGRPPILTLKLRLFVGYNTNYLIGVIFYGTGVTLVIAVVVMAWRHRRQSIYSHRYIISQFLMYCKVTCTAWPHINLRVYRNFSTHVNLGNHLASDSAANVSISLTILNIYVILLSVIAVTNTKWCAYMIYLNYVISNRSILDIRIDNLLLRLILWNIGLIPRNAFWNPQWHQVMTKSNVLHGWLWPRLTIWEWPWPYLETVSYMLCFAR